MRKPWRLLACAAALNVTVSVSVATAQTVIVRKAAPGSSIELVFNTATVASATADAGGTALVPVNLTKNATKTETDAYMYVDSCGQSWRVVIVERGVAPPPAGACTRSEMTGLFLMRIVTTVVIDVSGPRPLMRLRQGRAPAEWLRDEAPGVARERRSAPTGLYVSAGAGSANLSGAIAVSCGNVTQCGGDDSGFAYAASAGYWVARFLAVEASYIKPADVTASGSGTNYRFDSVLDAHVLGLAGKVGAPIGPVRLYAHVGPSYHRANFSTSQTSDPVDVTVGDVTTTIPGGTQTFLLRTAGWSWMFGGGLEAWATQRFAIYGEFGRAALKGASRDEAEGELDDRLTSFLFGARVRLGG